MMLVLGGARYITCIHHLLHHIAVLSLCSSLSAPWLCSIIISII